MQLQLIACVVAVAVMSDAIALPTGDVEMSRRSLVDVPDVEGFEQGAAEVMYEPVKYVSKEQQDTAAMPVDMEVRLEDEQRSGRNKRQVGWSTNGGVNGQRVNGNWGLLNSVRISGQFDRGRSRSI